MNIVLWNLEQLDINEAQRDALLEVGAIYDPHTGDEFDPGEGVYYPEDEYTLDSIEELLKTWEGQIQWALDPIIGELK